MNTNSSYQIDKASLNQTNGVVDVNHLVKTVEATGVVAQTTQTATSAVSDPCGCAHSAMSPEQQKLHVDEFKDWLLQRVEEIEKRGKVPVAKDENGRDLFSVFDFADLFVILDALAGCMPCNSDEKGEGNRFACFMTTYFPAINQDGECISFANAKYLYAAGRCGLLHNLGGKPGQKKLFYTHGTGSFWVKIDNQNGKMEFTLYAGQFCMAIKQAINKAFAIDSFRSGVNQRLERQDWIVALN